MRKAATVTDSGLSPLEIWGRSVCVFVLVAITCGGTLAVSAEPPAPVDRNFSAWDSNRDGVLTRDEVPPGPRRLFDRIDSNGDGQVTLAEHRAGGRQSPPPQTKKPPERQGPSSTGLIHHAIRQAWPQEPQGVQRPYTIKLPDQTVDRWPIVILLHGNGGEGARMIGNWPGLLPGWLVVAPQGYERSWNISTERSKAPDVTFIKQVLADVGRRYPQADGSRVSLIGSSNGAGMVFRLLIELDETVTVRHAVTLVSSMTTGQYHNGQFWKRANEATAVYDMPVVPVGKRRILTIHGTADTVVPYGGGRGPGGTHLSAQATAYAWAVQQGYQGRAVPDDAGRACGEGLIRYDYPAAKVSHIKVVAGRHGLGPAKTAVEAIVTEFLLAEQRAH
ncbi:MAG: hypothetical protein EBU59_07600 [Planctomycetia bacterium]|nr:hypothetical protein [Planctomycetia bacterium]